MRVEGGGTGSEGGGRRGGWRGWREEGRVARWRFNI